MGILRGRKHTLAYRALRRLPHAVFAVSEQVRQHAIKTDGIAAARVHTIHNGLDLEEESGEAAFPSKRSCPTITTIGNIRRVKGHDLLIRAAAEVTALLPNTAFTIAGEVLERDYFQHLQDMVRELGLVDRFRFVGKITDLRAHLRTADIFVLPSRSEGFSNALIEAMAAGVPAIATEVGGNPEAIQNGVSGVLVPAEDPSAISSAILRLLGAQEVARRMGAAGQRAVEARFTARAMVSRVSAVYASLLRDG